LQRRKGGWRLHEVDILFQQEKLIESPETVSIAKRAHPATKRIPTAFDVALHLVGFILEKRKNVKKIMVRMNKINDDTIR